MSGGYDDKKSCHLYHNAYVVCWKTVSKDAFNEKADDLQVDENLEGL
jgi:hypothetical protein